MSRKAIRKAAVELLRPLVAEGRTFDGRGYVTGKADALYAYVATEQVEAETLQERQPARRVVMNSNLVVELLTSARSEEIEDRLDDMVAAIVAVVMNAGRDDWFEGAIGVAYVGNETAVETAEGAETPKGFAQVKFTFRSWRLTNDI